MEKISSYIVERCSEIIPMSLQEREVVSYGLRSIFMTIEKFMLFLMIGIIEGVGEEVVIALLTFGSIRIFAGGIHMKTNMKCTVMMGVMIGISIFCGELLVIGGILISILWIISVFLLFKLAPVDFSNNHRWEVRRKCKNKMWAIVVMTGWYFLSFTSIFEEFRTVIIVSCLMEILTLIPRIWRGGKDYG